VAYTLYRSEKPRASGGWWREGEGILFKCPRCGRILWVGNTIRTMHNAITLVPVRCDHLCKWQNHLTLLDYGFPED